MHKLPIIIKADRAVYIIFTVLLSPCYGLGLYVALRSPEEWKLLFLGIFVLGIVLLWLSFFKISLFSDHLIYRSLFTGSQVVPYSDIRKIDLEIGVHSKLKPFYALNIYSEKYGRTPLSINMKLISRAELRRLTQLLIEHLGSGVIDKSIYTLAEGNIETISYQGMKRFGKAAVYCLFLFLVLALARSIILLLAN